MEAKHQGTLKALGALKGMMSPCILCPRQCRVDRLAGENGFCGLTAEIVVRNAMPHHGEEPPLSGTHGAGTIFFSSCNLCCLYCQNHQISRHTTGQVMNPEELALVMLRLQEQGCHNIDAVTPTPQTPLIMAALLSARRQGLIIPFVYNCGGYETTEVIRLLAGMVEIYLPDMKYGRDDLAWQLSGAKEYAVHAMASLREMAAQVGDVLEVVDGVARRGLLIRHLVLPGMIDNSFAILKMIRQGMSTQVPLSIMSQYTPAAQALRHPLLGRRLCREEYEKVVNYALELGFEQLFVQQVDERNLLPDFEKQAPFNWE
ncbi:MAG: radical SAM protein [Syntrophales bacterium]|jgi:putative pyruvate formate lyase activating enzyme|nr:radical SAM protein [Syntrophales bacterium]